VNKPNRKSAVSDEKTLGADKDKDGRGVSHLRHTGVGPRRAYGAASEKISGDAVTSLGSLEAELMGVLWEIGHASNSMEVAEAALYKRRGQGQKPISFATVTTTLRRLMDKGVLAMAKTEGRTPFYTPTVGREEMAARILNNVSQTLLGQPLFDLIPRLAESRERTGQTPAAEADQDEIGRLMQALQEAARTAPEPAAE
jgi:predicted transcriptional regulator